MNRKAKLAAAVALALGVAIVWPVAAHYRIQAQLKAYQRELAAKGEKLTIAELTPPFSSADVWSAKTLLALASRLRSAVPNFTNQVPLMPSATPGRAIISWQQDPLPTPDVANLWPGLSNDLAAAQAILVQAHTVVQSPNLNFGLDYSAGFNMALPHLMGFKSLAQWLSAETAFALHERRTADACESLQALVALVQHHKDEPIMISVLVRIAIGAIAVADTWELLQAPDLQDSQLRQLQAAWSDVDVVAQAEGSLSMERVMAAELFQRGRLSYGAISSATLGTGSSASGLSELAQMGKEVLDNPKEGLSKIARRYPGYWRWKCWQSYDDELAGDQFTQAGLEALRLARTQGGFGVALHQFEQATNTIMQAHPKAGRWLEYSPGGNIRGFAARVAGFEMQRAVVLTAIALQRYHLRYGAYPAQLSALAPDFVSKTPGDPADGQPLRYRLNPDGSFLLYSVGEDGVDNRGDPSPTGTLKNWRLARDMVWPLPASAQETQAYYDTLAAKRDKTAFRADAALRARYGINSSPAPATNTPSK